MENTPNIHELAQLVNALQGQLSQAKAVITGLQSELGLAKTSYVQAKQEITSLRADINGKSTVPKSRKPVTFKGTGSESIISWTTHMDNYLSQTPSEEAMKVAISYLDGNAHEWWIVHQQTQEATEMRTWPQLKDALVERFDTLNKEKIARDKLAKWKQLKDVGQFNYDFQRIILDIPDISVSEQIDRYTRGLKAYIWKELCTKEYTNLTDAMKDAERVEAAHRRLKTKIQKGPVQEPKNEPEPMELGNVQLKKLTLAEREKCMKEGRCLRCREKGHIAKNCPKAHRN